VRWQFSLSQYSFVVGALVIYSILQTLIDGLCSKMGSYYKMEIFNEHVQHGVLGWAEKAKKRSGKEGGSSPTAESMHGEDAA